jgi:hypothetical protein
MHVEASLLDSIRHVRARRGDVLKCADNAPIFKGIRDGSATVGDILERVSTGVDTVLQPIMLARSRSSSMYFFCERKKPNDERCTMMPRK